MDQRIYTNELAIAKTITRAEYEADKRAAAVMSDDIKQTLRDMNAKLDRLIEQRINSNSASPRFFVSPHFPPRVAKCCLPLPEWKLQPARRT